MSEVRKITLQFPSLRAFLAEYGARISSEGILLGGESLPEAGSRVELEVTLADGMPLLRARGETLWHGVAAGGKRERGAAVRFEELDDASRTLLERILDRRRREGRQLFQLEPGPRRARPRELTVPTVGGPGGVEVSPPWSEDSIFELGAPPAAPVEIDVPRAAAPGGQPAATAEPPLPEPEPQPVEAAAPPAVEEAAVEPAALEEAAESAEPDLAVRGADLGELFAGEPPREVPKSGLTEAFPPSFLSEVEAELEAVEPPPEISLAIEEAAMEAPPGAPAEEPAPAAPPAGEAPGQPAEVPTPAEEAAAPPELPPEETPGPDEALFEMEPAGEPPSAPPVETPPPAGDVAVGGETVEIPLPPAPPRRTEPSEPAPPPAGGDLLSIPLLEPETEAPPAPSPELPSPTPAEALRGAASRSRRFGTWLLIALLAGALAVAGILGFRLLRTERAAEQPDLAAPATLPRPAAPAPAEAGPGTGEPIVAEPSAAEGPSAGPAAGPEVAPPESAAPEPAPEPAAPPPAAAPESVEAPLTGLERITWSESGDETVLALVGDGAIDRERVELVPLTGADPRLVVKIGGVERAFQPAVLEVGTAQVQRVRTGLQAGGELHVVVDLADPGVSVRGLGGDGVRLEIRLGSEEG